MRAKKEKWVSGIFVPKNPQKILYNGTPKPIYFRSSWEAIFFRTLDETKNVLNWGSEILAIPYVSPLDNKIHKYYPDIYIIYQNKDNEIVRELIEIKPANQSGLVETKSKYLKETIIVNQAKWEAAQKYCEDNNIKFRVMTEKEIFGK